MRLTTDAIDHRGFFDPRYTCDIDNSSPELRWQEAPQGAAFFALLAEDADSQAGQPFAHWIVYNIPGNVQHLPAGIPPQDSLPNGIRQGTNGYGKLGYSGPCPPRAHRPHLYRFRLFALSAMPEFPHRANREQFLAAIQNVILAEAVLEGHYQRTLEQAG